MYFTIDTLDSFSSVFVENRWTLFSEIPTMDKLSIKGTFPDPADEVPIGAVATLFYKDGVFYKVVMLYRDHANPRSYLESAWAKGDIVHLGKGYGEGRLLSLPTRDLEHVEWFYLIGPRADAPFWYQDKPVQDLLNRMHDSLRS